MKKEITLYELLTLIQNHESPKEVMYKGNKYKICGNDYYSDSLGFHYLSDEIAKSGSMLGMLKDSNITYDAPVLTDEENAYLSAVLKPFKERAMRITKMDGTDGYNLVVDGERDEEGVGAYYYFPVFPYDSEMYRGMEVDRAYTPSELGLWEEE